MNTDNEQLSCLDVQSATLKNYVRMVLEPQGDLLQKAMQDYEQLLSTELLF